MRARLYRGPHDGRVLEVPNHQRSIVLKRRRAFSSPYVTLPADRDEFVKVQTYDDEYRMVTVTFSDDAGRIRTGPSIHPDGSVFFEWTEKRGTKIKR